MLCATPDTLKDRFVGRTEELWRIFNALETRRAQGATISCAIVGAGGVGKTQLATEYVWRYGTKYYLGGIVWVPPQAEALHPFLL